MSSPLKKHPDVVADRVLKRAELSKMARLLQNRLALAQFKTKHNLVHESLDTIEPRFEEELRRRRRIMAAAADPGDILSDSSSSASASDLPYPARTASLMSSPLKAGPLFSDAIGPSSGGGSTGHHRKRTYMASFEDALLSSSPSKRFRQSPTAHRSFPSASSFTYSSPIKPRRHHQHFTTSTGPDLSFYSSSRHSTDLLPPTNFAAGASDDDDDDEDDLPLHSFHAGGSLHSSLRASPPRTPPMRSRALQRHKKDKAPTLPTMPDVRTPTTSTAGPTLSTTGEEGADLLLYLATSPSPAVPLRTTHSLNSIAAAASRMDPPSTPPPKAKHLNANPSTATNNGANNNPGASSTNSKLDLPSSMMTTPGGRNPYPATPGLGFDFAEFLHMTPSPAPTKAWKTPAGTKTPGGIQANKTPRFGGRGRRLDFWGGGGWEWEWE
ncbi:uncharacterized protein CTHT_0048670 [Thermochaetoides thermophila DSM 1495]|uniref:Uncharacterized protein n=1 Tax=Chaetomium thermophilum (strain DSM 1495 / CBS 144.50 / IMI 039719) TaxID=759272 RepID=G0SB28_CHATD|nr:hypothetical protein CTHT_0048670 [Thermochaetoides thermophila DSM 1495]EGS19408.1 hypothetical protein CTHT_0048670 [Thermochaetoides thermophila DSM 1495]